MSNSRVTQAASAALLLSALIPGALVLGVVLCFLSVSYLPLIWAGGLAVVFALYFGGSVALWRKVIPLGYLAVGLAYSILFAWSIATYCSVERVERFECGWRLNADEVEVNLRPASGFSWSRVSSPELAERLRNDQPATVQVGVPIIRDFGRVRARGMIQYVEGIRVREP